jgi:hypothetical protein
MKKFIFKFGIYFIIISIVVNGIAWMSFAALRRSSMFKPSFLVNNFRKDVKFDYIILGGSTGLCTLNTNLIDSICKTNGLNLSEDNTGASSYLLMLQFFLSEGYKTKKVILTCDPGRVNDTKPTFYKNDYRIIPFIHKDVVFHFFKEREISGLPFRTFSKYFPALALAYYNQELFFSSILAMKNRKARHRFDESGNFRYPTDFHIDGKQLEDKIDTLRFTNSDIRSLDSICTANDIQLIYYLNPVYRTVCLKMDSSKLIINNRDLLKEDIYFYDRVHTNGKGTEIASTVFGETLKKYYLNPEALVRYAKKP